MCLSQCELLVWVELLLRPVFADVVAEARPRYVTLTGSFHLLMPWSKAVFLFSVFVQTDDPVFKGQ